VPSSVVAHFSYDPERSVLTVTITSGAVYEYQQIPVEVYEAMKGSFSKGTSLNTEIKPNYKYKKIG
jgi:hypothetical protein